MADTLGADIGADDRDDRPANDTIGWRRFIPQLGLRARVVLSFSIGALVLAAILSGLVLGVARSNLISSREASATRIFYTNARIVRSNVALETVLEGLQTPEGSRPLLFHDGRWRQLNTNFGEEALPESLRATVLGGQTARMRYELNGDKLLAIGVPIADIDGAYFEIVSLNSLDETLSSISFTLFGASIATVLSGGLLGAYASRRILRPLDEVGSAAQALAGGDLTARIRTLVDPDLQPIARSFNGMADSLQRRIDRDAQFASDVSHELRSPLMTLQAAVEVLDNAKDDMPERSRSAVDLLRSDIRRFSELVEDLLEISRFDAGVMVLDLEEVILPEFIRWAVGALPHTNVDLADIEVVASDDLERAIVAIDKRRIARVLANLIENASKYGDGKITVELSATDDHVHICVDDSGEGVPEEDRERIFERFNRAAAANRRGGAGGVGLGLALVAEHVRLHDGSVWVEDAPGGGARFTVQLPRIELPEDDAFDEAYDGEFA